MVLDQPAREITTASGSRLLRSKLCMFTMDEEQIAPTTLRGSRLLFLDPFRSNCGKKNQGNAQPGRQIDSRLIDSDLSHIMQKGCRSQIRIGTVALIERVENIEAVPLGIQGHPAEEGKGRPGQKLSRNQHLLRRDGCTNATKELASPIVDSPGQERFDSTSNLGRCQKRNRSRLRLI